MDQDLMMLLREQTEINTLLLFLVVDYMGLASSIDLW